MPPEQYECNEFFEMNNSIIEDIKLRSVENAISHGVHEVMFKGLHHLDGGRAVPFIYQCIPGKVNIKVS